MKVFIQVDPSSAPIGLEIQFKTKYGQTYTGMYDGEDFRNGDNVCPKRIVEYCLVPVELPTEEEIKLKLGHLEPYGTTFIAGAKYILNLLIPSHDPKSK